ncbi:hypothetical protein [Zavarzinia sp. CC-PAN008]|uniref:hypothetical protein n=1 Tax=Zavarzinia sp. CC-PAN008 TaxID=3243332 RepID=UPI003F745B74
MSLEDDAFAQVDADLARLALKPPRDARSDHRAALAAQCVPTGSIVLDLGAGAMALQDYLPFATAYLPVDSHKTEPTTIVSAVDRGILPQIEGISFVAALGLLEQVPDLPAFLAALRAYGVPAVVSYQPANLMPDDTAPPGRLGDAALIQACVDAGFHFRQAIRAHEDELVIRLDPDMARAPVVRRILAVSFDPVHDPSQQWRQRLLPRILPPMAEVVAMTVGEAAPEGPFDLVVLGNGGGIYQQHLNDAVLDLAQAGRRAVGLFGVDFRDAVDPGRVGALLDRLDLWLARSGEDALVYGHGRSNVATLGEWLVDLMPLRAAPDEQLFSIDAAVMARTPPHELEATLTRHRMVMARTPAALALALPSAHYVAYAEDRALGSRVFSGAYRSLLMDVFGRNYPENQLFEVDRSAVAAYKLRTRLMIDQAQAIVGQLVG